MKKFNRIQAGIKAINRKIMAGDRIKGKNHTETYKTYYEPMIDKLLKQRDKIVSTQNKSKIINLF